MDANNRNIAVISRSGDIASLGGKLIQYGYHADIYPTSLEYINAADTKPCTIIIFDSPFETEEIIQAVPFLKWLNPDVRMIIIREPGEELPRCQYPRGLRVLVKPVSAGQLLHAVATAYAEIVSLGNRSALRVPVWLEGALPFEKTYIPVTTRNISKGGLQLHSCDIDPGYLKQDYVQGRLYFDSDRGRWLDLPFQVCYTVPAQNAAEGVLIGGQFKGLSDYLARLVDNLCRYARERYTGPDCVTPAMLL